MPTMERPRPSRLQTTRLTIPGNLMGVITLAHIYIHMHIYVSFTILSCNGIGGRKRKNKKVITSHIYNTLICFCLKKCYDTKSILFL